jgi:hypothetical protein
MKYQLLGNFKSGFSVLTPFVLSVNLAWTLAVGERRDQKAKTYKARTSQNRRTAINGGLDARNRTETEQPYGPPSRPRAGAEWINRESCEQCAARENHGILAAFASRKKCQRCLLVIVDWRQLIESGKAEDLTHSRLRIQKDRFGATAIKSLSNGQSIRRPKEATKVTSDMSKRSGFALGTV